MSRQRDSHGRIVSGTVMGRKFCRMCGRWKHTCYFPPRFNKRYNRIYLQAECDVCRSRLARDHYRALKAEGGVRLQRRREQNLRSALRYKQRLRERDPNYVILTGSGRGQLVASKWVEFLNPSWVVDRGNQQAIFINGKRLTYSEIRMLHRWKTGENETVRLQTADAWAIRFDLPFWEIQETAMMAA